MPLSPGQTIYQRYRIVNLLGQGGFGAVYRAWDVVLKRRCALKECLDTSDEAQRQFAREARILANLEHPNLPRVTDYFSLPDQGQYLVMDFVEGEDLKEMLERNEGPLPEDQILPWIEQICDALVYLHTQTPPIIHRDIKPANIKITPQGKARLVDFGIAKIYDPNLSTTLGARAVTPGFAPHEQYGQGATDVRTDIYALGATLYNLLTGQQPPESILRVVNDPLKPAEELNSELSASTSGALDRALQIDPDQRFQNAAEFKAALQTPEAPPPALEPAVQAPSQISAPLQAPRRSAGEASPSTEAFSETRKSLLSRLPRWVRVLGTVLIVMLLLSGVIKGIRGQRASRSTLEPALLVIDLTNTPAPSATQAPPTNTNPAPSITPPPATETSLPSPTFTHTPTMTDTPTPYNAILNLHSSDVRSGPSNAYPSLGYFLQADELVVLGRNASGDWLAIKMETEKNGWIAVWKLDFDFQVDDLPVIEAPPLPTNTPGNNSGGSGSEDDLPNISTPSGGGGDDGGGPTPYP